MELGRDRGTLRAAELVFAGDDVLEVRAAVALRERDSNPRLVGETTMKSRPEVVARVRALAASTSGPAMTGAAPGAGATVAGAGTMRADGFIGAAAWVAATSA